LGIGQILGAVCAKPCTAARAGGILFHHFAMSIPVPSLDALRANFRGELITPRDSSYDNARRVWNALIDKRPAVVAMCAGAADVMATVTFAREQGLLLAVRGGGHSIAGNSTCDGGVVLDLSRMKGVRVDKIARAARAEGGVLWQELDHETQAFGLATTGGMLGDTGIAGLTLGGGFGWICGKYGLTIDNLLSVDFVLASGELVTANEHQFADLFWAARGGSGNFGVATSFEYRLHDVGPTITGGLVLHPLARAGEMLRFYREFIQSTPDELSVAAALITAPDGQKVAAMAAAHCGSLVDGERAVRPLKQFGRPILDAIGPLPYVAQQSLFKDGFPPHILNYWKADFITELSDGLISAAVDHYARTPSARSAMLWFPFSGAVSRVASDATAYPHRGGIHMGVYSLWTDPAEFKVNVNWARQGWELMRPVAAGGVYVNELGLDESDDRIRSAYGSNYRRLGQLKAKYDPTNLFRLNANIPPAP
jgi:FAD/FMN-containing dehydrogenase